MKKIEIKDISDIPDSSDGVPEGLREVDYRGRLAGLGGLREGEIARGYPPKIFRPSKSKDRIK